MFGNKGIVEDIPDGITKIRIWRELLVTCDKIGKTRTFDRGGDVSSIEQNWTFRSEKETRWKWTDININLSLLFRRVAKLVFSSSVVAFLHALIGPKRFRSYVIIFFEGGYIFGVNFSHGLGMLLRENRNTGTSTSKQNSFKKIKFIYFNSLRRRFESGQLLRQLRRNKVYVINKVIKHSRMQFIPDLLDPCKLSSRIPLLSLGIVWLW